MSAWKDLEHRIMWDFRIGEEFKTGREGYAFIVDVFDKVPMLSLYKVKKYSCESSPTKKQPPVEMLTSAVSVQGGDLERGGLFQISPEIREWIRKNLFDSDNERPGTCG